MFRRLIDRLLESIRKRIDKQLGKDTPSGDKTWRRDLQQVQASNNRIEFYTRNLTIPTGGGLNQDGGAEWIISRIHGSGYSRLLIMIMGGNRPASRILIEDSGGGPFWNSAWPMPLMDEATWVVEAKGGKLTITLDGREIWARAGNYTVTHAVMNGYPRRHSTGEWATGE